VRKNLFVLVVLFCFVNSAAWSQTVTPPASTAATVPAAASTMPTDPAELMKLAAEVNGLDSDKLAPWHLKATFQLYDFKGKPTEKGTYEEFWVSSKKYKIIYTSPSFNQTEWATEDGRSFLPVGSRDSSNLRFLIRSRLLNPVKFVGKGTLTSHLETLGNVQMNCVSVTPRQSKKPSVDYSPPGTYCFSQGEPILRTVNAEATMSVSNRIIRYQNHYLPKSLQVTNFKRPYLDLQIESLDSLDSIDQRDFTPPADAEKEENRPMQVSAQMTLGHLVSSVDPEYPTEARALRLEGVAVARVTVGKDGLVLNPYISSTSDAMFVRPTLEAVKKYKFSPFLLNGAPVEVEIAIEVKYRI
jgi:TonB family protein